MSGREPTPAEVARQHVRANAAAWAATAATIARDGLARCQDDDGREYLSASAAEYDRLAVRLRGSAQ